MSLPAQDNFNRADGGLGSNWTTQQNAAAIVSNRVVPAGSFTYEFWNADAFPDDQYGQAVLGGAGVASSNQYTGVLVRASGTGGSLSNYFLYCDAVSAYLYKTVSGSGSLLQTFTSAATGAHGLTFKLTVEGTTLRAYKSGGQIGSDQTDSSLTSGAAGLGGLNSSATLIDDWEGGSMGGGAANHVATLVQQYHGG